MAEETKTQDSSKSNPKSQFIIWAVILILVVVGVGAAVMTRGEPTETQAVARVDGQSIQASELEPMVQQMAQQYQMQGMNIEDQPELAEQIRQQALLTKIQQLILLGYAEEQGISVSEEKVEEEYQQSVGQFQGGEEELETALLEAGINKEGFRREIREGLTLRQLAEEQAVEPVTDEEISNQYNQIAAQQDPENEMPPLSEVEQSIRMELEQSRQVDSLDLILSDLLPKAEIEILDEAYAPVKEMLSPSPAPTEMEQPEGELDMEELEQQLEQQMEGMEGEMGDIELELEE